ncbi:MAG TPA: hypothetical protein VIG30_16345 [Ktedonobacterales bacterium]
MATVPSDRAAILDAGQGLPPGEQLEVARQIMRRYLATVIAEAPVASWVSWRELAGIGLAPGQEPPTDEQITQWLDERHMKEAQSRSSSVELSQWLDQLYGALEDAPLPEITTDPLPERREEW